MNKKLFGVGIILVALIAASLWYSRTSDVTITYGPEVSTTNTAVTANADVRADAVQTAEASAEPATSPEVPRPVEAPRETPQCDSIRISIEATVYAPCASGEVTVLSAMQTATKDGLVFSGRDYPSFGFFVDSINGKKAESGYYWFLYINDESSSLGASQTLVKAGDVVEWRYKQSY